MLNVNDHVERFLVAGDQTKIGIGEQSSLYLRLVTEELVHETVKEFDRNNIVGIADGIADTIWVLEGFRISLGIDKEEVWNSIEQNLNEPSYIRRTPNVTISNLLLDYAFLRKEYNWLLDFSSEYTYKLDYITESLSDILLELLFLAEDLNIPIQEVYDEVARSNFTKVGDSGKMIKNEYGKIQKPETYSPPNIQAILDKAKLTSK